MTINDNTCLKKDITMNAHCYAMICLNNYWMLSQCFEPPIGHLGLCQN